MGTWIVIGAAYVLVEGHSYAFSTVRVEPSPASRSGRCIVACFLSFASSDRSSVHIVRREAPLD